jgi:coenzyme F420-0:L-glutamate ligase / coenzyme F420-1:gamma-L-glutamate ligase
VSTGDRDGTTDLLLCLPVEGIGEVTAGAEPADLVAAAIDLHDGDILVVTSKIVSKAEGRTAHTDRSAALAGETDRVVATRGPTSIVRTHHGLVMAAAGVDASNTQTGTVVLLPVDPDASAKAIRERLARTVRRNVAVLVTDTAGRAWRTGQTDIAIGAAGLAVLHDYAGRHDDYGNELAVTAPAVADELAGAADLVKGKLAHRPAAVVRGLAALVLPPGEHGPGARSMVRPEAQDMFGLGARDAVLRAMGGDPADVRGFAAPCDARELVVRLAAVAGPDARIERSGDGVTVHVASQDGRRLGRLEGRLPAVAFAFGWLPDESDPTAFLRFLPAGP